MAKSTGHEPSEMTRLAIAAILASGERGTLRQRLSHDLGDGPADQILGELRAVGIDVEAVGKMKLSEVRAEQERLRRAYYAAEEEEQHEVRRGDLDVGCCPCGFGR